MVRNLVGFMSVLVLGGVAQAGLVVDKVFDGQAVYCPAVDDGYSDQRIVTSEISGDELVLSMVVCKNGQWQTYTKTDVHGTGSIQDKVMGKTVVRETFHHFSLLVASPDASQFEKIELNGFARNGEARISVAKINDLMTRFNVSTLDLNLMAMRSTITSEGYTASEEVPWGQIRVSK